MGLRIIISTDTFSKMLTVCEQKWYCISFLFFSIQYWPFYQQWTIVLFSIWLKRGRSPPCWCLSREKACCFLLQRKVRPRMWLVIILRHLQTFFSGFKVLSWAPLQSAFSLGCPSHSYDSCHLALTCQALLCLHLHQRSECLPMSVFPISCLHLFFESEPYSNTVLYQSACARA